MRKLSLSMVDALRLVAQGPIDDMISLINLGDRRTVTLKALERRGLCAWHPYGQDSRGHRTGSWRITKAGRTHLDDLEAIAFRAAHQAQIDRIVGDHREGRAPAARA